MAFEDFINEALADARDVIREHTGHHALDEADIVWESHAVLVDGEPQLADAQLSHAIGFVHGFALALDVTPLTLLDQIPERTETSPTYRCPVQRCRWVGSDPHTLYRSSGVIGHGTVTTTAIHYCPACIKHDRKKVEVVEVTSANGYEIVPPPTPSTRPRARAGRTARSK